MQLGGEKEEEKAGEDLSNDEKEKEEGEGVGEGGGGAASRDQAQSPNQKENTAWNQGNIFGFSDEMRIDLIPRKYFGVFE